ncbi:MAG: hypothetical protein H0U13_07465 [Gemmatimonadaceae bacterium]|nr:hypothetical protein [Gemmatimonadaceae bacterium]
MTSLSARRMDLETQLKEFLGDNYTLERELGGGGMSRVFAATDTALGRKVVGLGNSIAPLGVWGASRRDGLVGGSHAVRFPRGAR